MMVKLIPLSIKSKKKAMNSKTPPRSEKAIMDTRLVLRAKSSSMLTWPMAVMLNVKSRTTGN